MVAPVPDRNLLYGAIARRLGVASDAALMDALCEWSEHPEKSLGLILLERRSLRPEDHARVEAELRRIAERSMGSGSDAVTLDFATADRHGSVEVRAGSTQQVADDGATTLADPGNEKAPDASTLATTVEDPLLRGAEARPRSRVVPEGSRFRVVAFHAQGGLGKVSRAWDEQLGREVALKEMLPGRSHNEERRARFILEAEVNGKLEHPGIVPVYALGEFPDGRPYYAMRFVEGQTLKEAVERFHRESGGLPASGWNSGLRRLLAHFLDVCDAIAYAHSRGVLHRDIKPSNVLLGGFGQTHIIDWGVAKPVGHVEPGADGKAGDVNAPLQTTIGGTTETLAGCVLGSPSYMSPEQASGRLDDLDFTSDVYGLGATLYTILTGREPVKGASTRATLELVRQGAIEPPRSVNPRVPPPLDSVCRKAMRLVPADRYPSAHALADDVRRWMADEPVSVHPESFSTRALRWARNHRPLVSASAALFLTAFVTLAIATVVVRQQRNETAAALVETQKARELAEYHALNGVKLINELVTLGDRQFISTNVSPERRRQLLQSALHFIRATQEGQPDDPSIQVESALVARRLAHLYGLGGDYERAEPLFAESVRAFEQIVARHFPNPYYHDLLVEVLIDQAECRKNCGPVPEARAPINRAVELARENLARAPERPDARRVLARSLYRSSEILRKLGEFPAPDPSIEAVQLLRPLADSRRDDGPDEVQRGRIHALTDQLEYVAAVVFVAESRLARGESGEAQLREAVDRMDGLASRFQGYRAPDIDYFRAWTGWSLARTLIDDPASREEARRRLDDAIRRLTDLTADNQEFLHYQVTLAEALASRAQLALVENRSEEARADAEDARKRLKALIAAHPQVADLRNQLGAVEGVLGELRSPAPRTDPGGTSFEDSGRATRDDERDANRPAPGNAASLAPEEKGGEARRMAGGRGASQRARHVTRVNRGRLHDRAAADGGQYQPGLQSGRAQLRDELMGNPPPTAGRGALSAVLSQDGPRLHDRVVKHRNLRIGSVRPDLSVFGAGFRSSVEFWRVSCCRRSTIPVLYPVNRTSPPIVSYFFWVFSDAVRRAVAVRP
jgi:serine/threonine protein kinase